MCVCVCECAYVAEQYSVYIIRFVTHISLKNVLLCLSLSPSRFISHSRAISLGFLFEKASSSLDLIDEHFLIAIW